MNLPNPPNTAQDGHGFYVSFNEDNRSLHGGVTTALVYGQMEAFFILLGDHRAAYRPLIPQGYNACLAYFRANVQLAAQHSEHARILTADDSDVPALIRAYNQRLCQLIGSKKRHSTATTPPGS